MIYIYHIYIYIYISYIYIYISYIYIHTHTRTYIYTVEYYSAITKNKIMSFAATWMELEAPILCEVSQKEKEIYHMISLISGI